MGNYNSDNFLNYRIITLESELSSIIMGKLDVTLLDWKHFQVVEVGASIDNGIRRCLV